MSDDEANQLSDWCLEAPVRIASLTLGFSQPLRGEGHANLRFSSEMSVFGKRKPTVGLEPTTG